MNSQEQAWAGKFGDEYLKRNRVDWRERIPLWEDIVILTGARSFSEFGANAGWNLSAIKEVNHRINVKGVEINQTATAQALAAGLDVRTPSEFLYQMPRAELTFTAGVLIHIPPEKIESVMIDIAAASYDYVLAIEYASETGDEEEINYRGMDGMLWRRDYGKLYEQLGLKTIESFKVSQEDGFDNCTAWLMRK